jgi:hypothetical protein
MVPISLAPALALMYFYIRTFRSYYYYYYHHYHHHNHHHHLRRLYLNPPKIQFCVILFLILQIVSLQQISPPNFFVRYTQFHPIYVSTPAQLAWHTNLTVLDEGIFSLAVSLSPFFPRFTLSVSTTNFLSDLINIQKQRTDHIGLLNVLKILGYCWSVLYENNAACTVYFNSLMCINKWQEL